MSRTYSDMPWQIKYTHMNPIVQDCSGHGWSLFSNDTEKPLLKGRQAKELLVHNYKNNLNDVFVYDNYDKFIKVFGKYFSNCKETVKNDHKRRRANHRDSMRSVIKVANTNLDDLWDIDWPGDHDPRLSDDW